MLIEIEINQQITTEILYNCCYDSDHTFKGSVSILNSQNGILVNIGKFDNTDIINEI